MKPHPSVGALEHWPNVVGTPCEGGNRLRGLTGKGQCDDLPLISIITVARNPGSMIYRTLSSVRRQSYTNIEYIVIDGASTDGTVAWLRQNESQIDYWVSEPDSSLYEAMNKGLMLARGSIIGLLNCGDEYTEQCCELVARKVPTHRSREPLILAGSVQRTDEEKKLSFRLPATPRRFRDRIAHGMPLNHPATFVTAEAYRAVGLFDASFKLCGDYELIFRAFRHGGIRFEFTDETLAVMPMGGISERVSNLWTRAREHYRIRKGSVGLPLNLLKCGQLLAVGTAKLLTKMYLSRAILRSYYRRRHSG